MQLVNTAPLARLMFRPNTRHERNPPGLAWKMAQAVIGSAMAGSYQEVTRQGTADAQTIQPTMTAEQLTAQKNTGAEATLEQVLGKSKFDAFKAVSAVSMHLRPGWRERLFAELNYLLDVESWDPDDQPLQAASFGLFLAGMIDIKAVRCPSLGLTYDGNVVAGWREPIRKEDRVSLEFTPQGKVIVIGSWVNDGEVTSFSARTPVKDLKTTLHNLQCAGWLDCATE